MFIGVTLFFLIFTTYKTNSELHGNSENSSLESRSYKYNHPPSFEQYVYDPEEFEVRNKREVTEEYDIVVTKDIYLGETGYEDNSGPEKLTVAIIDEATPNIKYVNDNASHIVKVKRRKLSRNSEALNKNKKNMLIPEVKKNLTEPENVVTENNLYVSPTLRTIVPKVFTKRPPEYNPVTKKIRQRDPVVKIIEETNYVFSHSGTFQYSFEGGDGTKVSSQGHLKSIDDDKEGEAVVGSIFYKDNDGNNFSLSYTADENGYRPRGAHLPTPPPIPPAIARALKYLATATTPESVTKPTTTNV